MEQILLDILGLLRESEPDGNAEAGRDPAEIQRGIERILARANRLAGGPVRRYAKKQLIPYYLSVRENDPERWRSWNVDPDLEAGLLAALRLKPRRTSSGVATITVITKPWPCTGRCLYCPNDVRMPKSYLHDEPACQRAERNFFDPYLQTASRLQALVNMGHPTDKIELIVLGGTFCDYPESYRIWFVEQLFEAINDGPGMSAKADTRRALYRNAGFSDSPDAARLRAAGMQRLVDAGEIGYNEAVGRLYRTDPICWEAKRSRIAGIGELEREQRRNEDAGRRVVGLAVETRPDTVDPDSLRLLRRLGCTKLQMGIQSTDPRVLAANGRGEGDGSRAVEQSRRAIDLARLFGFKLHAHLMVNLCGSTPERDVQDYRRFMEEPAWRPDEVKLYPCVLVEGTPLSRLRETGAWQPYPEDVLVDVLAADVLATPEFCRISRMVRDISAADIAAGNKKSNLRQLVEARAEELMREGARLGRADAGHAAEGKRNGASGPGTGPDAAVAIREIRYREIKDGSIDPGSLAMRESSYETLHTREIFLQWVTEAGRIAGFLRLSLPHPGYAAEHPELPIGPGQAMIREVHVYGRAASLDAGGAGAGANAQHAGLGRKLVQRACELAREAGYSRIKVISAVGTRNYYRRLGFSDEELYQAKDL